MVCQSSWQTPLTSKQTADSRCQSSAMSQRSGPADVGQVLATIGQKWPMFGKPWLKPGQNRPSLGNSATSWPFWAQFGKSRPITLPQRCQNSPTSARRSVPGLTVQQLLGDCLATVGHQRNSPGGSRRQVPSPGDAGPSTLLFAMPCFLSASGVRWTCGAARHRSSQCPVFYPPRVSAGLAAPPCSPRMDAGFCPKLWAGMPSDLSTASSAGGIKFGRTVANGVLAFTYPGKWRPCGRPHNGDVDSTG